MKKFILVILIMLFSVTVFADKVDYSANLTADATIVSGKAEFHGITITGDGTNVITVDIHNGTSTSGEKIVPTITFAQNANTKTQSFGVYPPVDCSKGIYVNITTAGTASYVVYFKRY